MNTRVLLFRQLLTDLMKEIRGEIPTKM